MPTSIAPNTGSCGDFQLTVGMTARSALRLSCRRRHDDRILHVAARLTRHARRTTLHLQDDWPWAAALLAAFERLDALPTYG